MKYILTEEQYNKLFEQSNRIGTPLIIKLFKLLNEEKKKNKTRAGLLDAIKHFAPYMNIPKGYELYLLELYLLNYRKDGDYSDLSKENFIDPRTMKGKTTSNTNAKLYTVAQLPFKGSNLQGFWDEDYNGNSYYKVVSYGWYPVYLFKDDKWYEVTKRYSSSTSKQMYNANPVDWDDFLNSEVYLITPDEMKMLERGKTHDEVMKSKLERLKSLEPQLKSKRMSTAKTYNWGGEVPNTNIKYKINSVDLEGDKAIVTVDVYDVLSREGGKGVPTTKNYLKGEIPNLSIGTVEGKIKSKLRGELKDFVGTRFRYYDDEEPPKTKIEFKFNHLKK